MDRNSLIGQTLGGRYKINEILGRGGMSTVYKAYDPNLRRVVAIKMIHGHLADDPKFVARFEEEATTVAQLRHPNIVQVFDFNHDGDQYYMVQELVPGETLQERLRRLSKTGKRMPADEAIRYILNICDAAGYAHLRGMIHRDIKPANIMLDTQGQAVLMDFGIVKITGAERHTATGAVVGTALYLPPEVIRGEAPDARSDLYSLGVTLYEMVSGRPPFEADSAMTLMMMHLQEPVPNLRGLCPDVPEGLVAVIERSLAKDRDHRYGSMADMAAALKAVLGRIGAGTPLPATQIEQPRVAEVGEARPAPETVESRAAALPGRVPIAPAQTPGDMPRPPRAGLADPGRGAMAGAPHLGGAEAAAGIGTRRRKGLRPVVWIAGAAILLVLVIGGMLLSGLLSGSERPPATPVVEAGVLVALRGDTSCLLGPSPEYPEAVRVNAGQQLAVLGMSADEAWWNVSHPQDPTASCWLPTRVADVSGDISTLPLVEAPPLPTATASLSVAIQGIAADAGNRYVVDYVTSGFSEELPGTHLHFFFDTFDPEQVGMSGTGNRLMYGGPSPFTGYRTEDRPVEATAMCVLVANPDHSVVLASGNCFPLPAPGGDASEAPTATRSAEVLSQVTQAPPPATVTQTPVPETPTSAPTDTPVVLTPTPVPPTRTAVPVTATAAPPATEPIGPRFGRLAFTSRRDGNPEIYAMNLAGGNAVRLTTNPGDDWLPDWTPDGSGIAFTSNRQGGYDTWGMEGDGTSQVLLLSTSAWDDYPRWSPDGQRLVLATTAMTEGVANSEIHAGPPGSVPTRLTNTTAEDQWPDWSPDGRIIFAEGLKGTSDWDLYVTNGDGSGRTLWLGGPACDVQPTWSPDGQWVAFIRHGSDTNGSNGVDEEDAGDLWVARADGSGLRQLTFGAWTITPAWSPDSRWIAVSQLRDSNSNGRSDVQDDADIWAIPLAGGEPVLLVQSPARDSDPSWAW